MLKRLCFVAHRATGQGPLRADERHLNENLQSLVVPMARCSPIASVAR